MSSSIKCICASHQTLRLESETPLPDLRLAVALDNDAIKPPDYCRVNTMIQQTSSSHVRRADPGTSPDPGDPLPEMATL